ncbi:unnamed protein product [Urochloa humidicola]
MGMFLLLLIATATSFSLVAHANSVAGASCIPRERDALLAFKQAISSDPAARLASWREENPDCCRWRGVHCSNVTGHVLKLHLRALPVPCSSDDEDDILGTSAPFPCYSGTALQGQIAPSVLFLEHLEYLDLSWNSFQEGLPRLPGNLRYLNLSNTWLEGVLQPQLGNLSNLKYLDISNTGFRFRGPQLGNLTKLQYLDISGITMMNSSDMSWVEQLPRLRYLDLGYVNLSSASNWVHAVNMVPSLRVLSLSDCDLASANQSLPYLNLTKLERLDLSRNIFNHTAASCWFWNLTSLEYLSLSDTGLFGQVPDALAGMTSLRVLEFSAKNSVMMRPRLLRSMCELEILNLEMALSSGNMTELIESLQLNCSYEKIQELNLAFNFIHGTLPTGMGRFASLVTLELGGNKLTGLVPLEISMLANLTVMGLGSNDLHGVIREEHFSGLRNLRVIDLSYNQLEIAVGPEWLPPFIRLEDGYFSSCHMGPLFPSWLQHLLGIDQIDISSAGIVDQLPDWFYTAFAKATVLDMSNNSIRGGLPDNMEIMSLKRLVLGSNQLTGPIPTLPRNLTRLDLSNNSLSGPLPSNFGTPNLRWVHLSSNYFSSHIPGSICELQELRILDLSSNLLEGEFPQCSGTMSQMNALILSNNSLSGMFPYFLQGSTNLGLVDLSGNKFTGSLPIWIGDLTQLQYLRLSNNLFYGNIPHTVTNLGKLYDLNLAGNGLSGVIPYCLSNLTAMARSSIYDDDNQDWYFDTTASIVSVVTKGQELHYGFALPGMVSIDLSSNHLIGRIPDEIASLGLLKNLNLSRNYLNGKIPHTIGSLKSLESLDLSSNKFAGEIPYSLSNLSYLSYLNLSHKNLSGTIPSGSQLDTLYLDHPDMYSGNNGLCGPPLRRNCSGVIAKNHVYGSHNKAVHVPEPVFFYLGLGAGLVVGLWVVFCILLFKKTWRIAYFLFFDKVYDKVYVFTVVNWASFAQKTTAR